MQLSTGEIPNDLQDTTAQQSLDQPDEVVNPARGQLNRENEYSPIPVRA